MLAVTRRRLGGQAVGQVPPGTDRPPLLRDFEARARRQRLKIDDPQPRRLVLDPIDGTRGLMHDKRAGFVLADRRGLRGP